MKRANDFLKKFQSLTPPHDALKKAIVNAARVYGVNLSKGQVKMHNATAYIEAPSIIKNKIRIHRGDILRHIHTELPKSSFLIRDIR